MKIKETWLGKFPLPYPHKGTQILKVYQTVDDDFYVEGMYGDISRLTRLQENKLLTNKLID